MNIVLLLARQRSGTGAFGSVLDMHSEIKYLGEIFHPDQLESNDNYFGYIQDKVKPTELPLNHNRMFDQYLQYLANEYKDKIVILDVKYRSLHNLNGPWQGLYESPGLVKMAKEKDLKILHLTRNNYIQTFVSGILAEKNRIWHATKKDEIGTQSLVVNIPSLSRYLIETDNECSSVNRWLNSHEKKREFDYSSVFDQFGHVTKETLEAIAEFLEVDSFKESVPHFIKQAPRLLTSSIQNYELLRVALESTPYYWMLDS